MTEKPPSKSAKPARKPAARRPPARPTLLSGGNPQIPKGYGDAPVQAYVSAMPGWKHDVGRRLDALITRTVPGVRKAVKWNSPFYGAGDETQGWFLSFHCFTKYVKVTFFRGTSLHPAPPVESKHKDVRYLHIHEHDDVDEPQLTAWVKQASEAPGGADVSGNYRDACAGDRTPRHPPARPQASCRVLYLDQNAWIALAQGAWDAAAYPAQHVALRCVIEAQRSDRLVVPLSYANIYETGKINACLSGCYPHPLDVGWVHSPE